MTAADSSRSSKSAGREALDELIAATAWIDTHEHLVEEEERLGEADCVIDLIEEQLVIPADFTSLFSLYALDDLRSAGLGGAELELLSNPEATVDEKWRAVEPYLALTRHTGYLRAVDLSTERLFGLRLGPETYEEIDRRLRELRRPGYYRHVLNEVAGVERCHVHSLEASPFRESADPELLQQDISVVPLMFGRHPRAEQLSGIEIATLDDYLELLEWCFDSFASRAVAIKCHMAYFRSLKVEPPAGPPRREFERLRGDEADPAERRLVEDFLLWRCIELATEHGLPVKIHVGALGGNDNPNLRWVFDHVRHIVPLVQAHPDARFVLMHIAWPQSEQLLEVAKHQTNVWVDLCWATIAAPLTTTEFIQRFLTTVPANKLFCFGADYLTVENVVGHAEMARQGLGDALAGLVSSEWLTQAEAEALVPALMRENAIDVFPR